MTRLRASTRTSASLSAEAYEVRKLIVEMTSQREGAHVGGSLSVTDILCVLFHRILNLYPDNPDHPDRDFFILSKGHAVAALYAVLARRGFLAPGELQSYASNGSRLSGHPSSVVPGIEFPTGSLGHGLGLGVGVALGLQRQGRQNRTVVVLGDGELQEGSVWEAIASAPRLGLERLLAIVDRNSLQINGAVESWLPDDAHCRKWAGFGWGVLTCDGHDLNELEDAIDRSMRNDGRPHMVLARTIKGKGIPSLENKRDYHYAAFPPQMRKRMLAELEAAYQ